MFTVKIVYTKEEPIKFISHLDHMRVLERAIRRASLPIAYSQGFNPRMKLSFKTRALKVGETSAACEAEIIFETEIAPKEVKDQLNKVLPIGFRVIAATVALN